MPEAGFARRLAEGFSLPGVVLAVVVGTGVGALQHRLADRPAPAPPGPAAPRPPAPARVETPPVAAPTPPPAATSAAPTPAPPAGEEPIGAEAGDAPPPVTAAGVLAAISEGRLEEALEQARTLGDPALLERAHLLWSLTRAIPVSPLAQVNELLEVTTRSGASVLGAPLSEEGGLLTLATVDGERKQLRTGDVLERRTYGGDAVARHKGAALERARAALGADASGLALHRLALQALAAGCPEVGVRLLEEALVGPDGEIVVDTFGEGDPARLRRARRALAGEPEPSPAAAQPLPAADPEAEVEVQVEEGPFWPTAAAPQPEQHGPDPLLSEPAWLEADASYKTGLALFRETFGGRADDLILRAAQREFSKALDTLDRLAPRYPEHYELERRRQELAKLSVDCMKRQRVD